MSSPIETPELRERPDQAPPGDAIGACELPGADAGRVAWTRTRLVSEDAAGDLADTFRVLGDPTRVRLIDALSHGELCVCDLAAVIGLSESAVSHQLRLLRSMRLVRARKSGRQVFYALDDHHILDLFAQGRRHVEEHGPGAGSPEPRAEGRR
jgi:DNA-binding transcriptional ArsR family regulator